MRQKGILLEYASAYSPPQNRKSERMNQILQNKFRAKLKDSGISKNLWGKAILCNAYEQNRSPSESLPAGKTPALLWHGGQDLSKLRIFGCRAWCITLPKESKFFKA